MTVLSLIDGAFKVVGMRGNLVGMTVGNSRAGADKSSTRPNLFNIGGYLLGDAQKILWFFVKKRRAIHMEMERLGKQSLTH